MDNEKFRQIKRATQQTGTPTREEVDTIWSVLEEIVEDAQPAKPRRSEL